jgi:hypothetical protein
MMRAIVTIPMAEGWRGTKDDLLDHIYQVLSTRLYPDLSIDDIYQAVTVEITED